MEERRLDGPAGAPALKRWGILPLTFALAGAAGGVAAALASQAVIGQYGWEAEACAWIGGGIGLGIGFSLSLSRRFWIAVALAPVLGGAGYALSVLLFGFVSGDLGTLSPTVFLRDLSTDELFTLLAVIASPVLVAAHAAWLRWPSARSLTRSVPFYALAGAVSGSVFWLDMAGGLRDLDHLAMGLANGAIYGAFQYAAMRLALAMPAPAGELRTRGASGASAAAGR